MKLVAVVILTVVLVVIVVQTYTFFHESRTAEAEYERAVEHLTKVRGDYAQLEADKEYFDDPVNLEKELRARFNYRAPGEHMIIVVPPRTISDED